MMGSLYFAFAIVKGTFDLTEFLFRGTCDEWLAIDQLFNTKVCNWCIGRYGAARSATHFTFKTCHYSPCYFLLPMISP